MGIQLIYLHTCNQIWILYQVKQIPYHAMSRNSWRRIAQNYVTSTLTEASLFHHETYACAYRWLPLFLELSSGGGASRPRKVVHYLQLRVAQLPDYAPWYRARLLSFFNFFFFSFSRSFGSLPCTFQFFDRFFDYHLSVKLAPDYAHTHDSRFVDYYILRKNLYI